MIGRRTMTLAMKRKLEIIFTEVRNISWLPGAIGFGIVLYIGWVFAGQPSAARAIFGLAGVTVSRFIAAMALWLISRRPTTKDEERTWRFFAAGFILWASADLIAGLFWIIFKRLPTTPSIVDWLRMAGYLSSFAALVIYPASPPERFRRIRDLLDVMILSLAILALSWLVFLSPVIELELADPIPFFWISLTAVFDMVLAVLVLRIVLLCPASSPRIGALLCIGAAYILLAIGDLFSGYLLTQNGRRPGSMVEAIWMAANLVLSIAAVWICISKDADQTAKVSSPHKPIRIRLELWLPILMTYIVVGFILFNWRLTGQVDRFGLGMAILISVLLIARQGVIVGQFEMRQFATLVNTTEDVAFICQADGLLRLANPALRKIIDCFNEPLDDIHLSDFLSSKESTEEILAKALETGWTGEVDFVTANGESIPFALALQPIQDEHDKPALLAATAHDLSQVKKRESELQRALKDVAAARVELQSLNEDLEKKVQARTKELEAMVAELAKLNKELKKLDRLKSEFVALVSHELRAPLTNIRSGVELLLDGNESLTNSSHSTLVLVQAETERLSEFVETILDLSALEAGKFSLFIMPLSLPEVIKKVQERFPEATLGHRLSLIIPEGLPLIDADERALNSVLYHLIDNSLKYAPKGRITFTAEAQDQGVRMMLYDEGPGIPDDEQERIFEMFHRLDSSDSKEVYGHGLGLPLAQRFMEAMGGWIRVDPINEIGACLVLWLPQAEECLPAI